MDESATSTIDAPRCPTCGYLLLGLTEFRCPECGGLFDPAYVEDASFRVHLLPWERPETGGRLRRLARTLLQASLHPGRFFGSLNERKDRPIKNAGKLIAASVIVSLCFYAVEFFVGRTAFFIQWLGRPPQPLKALDLVVKLVEITWASELQLRLMQVLSVLLTVLILAVLISRVFRPKLDSLRLVDIAAAYSPAIAFGAFIAACAHLVAAVSHAMIFLLPAMYSQVVVVLLLVWFCCRRLLSLSRWKTVGMLAVSVVLEYLCAIAISLFFFLLVTLPTILGQPS